MKSLFIITKACLIITISLMMAYCSRPHNEIVIENPLIDGYFADPAVVKHEGKYYVYATKDPWGGNDLAVFETVDFINWQERSLNWPTKEACTSPTSGDARVWAPDVIRGKDGKFYMYISVGSEIWVGVSDHPVGHWENAKPDMSPLVTFDAIQDVHSIDANCFIDDDGQIYLYWGSGFNWVNGRCMAVKLSDDMVTFLEGPIDVTPPNFFEGAFMIKKNNKYYLMYSDGKAIDHTYKVRYSIGDTPFGPWTEGKHSPILETSADSTIYGPGHHSVFSEGGQDYILYHRIYPQDQEYLLRQLCIDSLNFDNEGNIHKIVPTGVKKFIN